MNALKKGGHFLKSPPVGQRIHYSSLSSLAVISLIARMPPCLSFRLDPDLFSDLFLLGLSSVSLMTARPVIFVIRAESDLSVNSQALKKSWKWRHSFTSTAIHLHTQMIIYSISMMMYIHTTADRQTLAVEWVILIGSVTLNTALS